MSKKVSKAIAKDLNRDTISNVSSDFLTDAIYSFATDLLKGLYEDDNLKDLDRAIATVNTITKDISSGGINLRKANIERRKKDKKDVGDDVPTIEKDNVKWTKYPKNKRLEYTTTFLVNGKYPLKKRREDVIVGLIKEAYLEDDYVDKGKYKMSSKEKEAIFSMGFMPDNGR